MEINEINNPQNISLEKIKTIRVGNRYSIIAANRTYIITEHENQSLKIENINTNLFSIIKFDFSLPTVKFHPKFENIFLLAEENIIKIYEIIKDKCQCEERVNVSGHSKPIITAVFSSTDDKIFATFSLDKTLKVWNLENPFCICNILLNNLITEIQIYKNYIFYYDKAENSIIQYDYEIFRIKNKFKYNTKDYAIFNEKELCLFYENSLSIIENNIEIKNYKLADIYYKSFYDEDLKILYIFYENGFDIINKVDMKPILTGKINGEPDILYFNALNEVNICVNFILLFKKRLDYYSLFYKDGYKLKINTESNKISLYKKNIWVNVVPTISNIENLKWTANCEENVSFKKYLNNPEIIKELGNNYDKSLDEKKIDVENEIKYNKTLKLDYMKLLKLIIKDNTNKNLIIKYLKYLEANNNELREKYNDNIENFNKEYENYKIIFDNKELKENGLEEKTYSQKQIFMNLLERIKILEINDDENDINNNEVNNNDVIKTFRDEIEEIIKHLQLFNQPILISNKELYWQRNCHILYFALKDILKNKNKLKLMKEAINIILEKKIFDKEYITCDNVLLSNIMILIVIPQPKKILEFNLNLIETKDPSYNYKNELNDPIFTKLDKKDKKSYYLTYNNKDYFLNEPSTKCVKNFILGIKKEIYLEEFEEKTYNGLKDFFNEIIDFDKMISFLSKIFTSKVIRKAFNYLYPPYFKGTAGITEKFSLDILYFKKKKFLYFQNIT